MSRFNKKKIALALACASVFGGKNSLAAQNAGRVGGAVTSSKKFSSLAKGLIIGGSVLGTGLIGYEILGNMVFKGAPTLLKLIRGKGINKPKEHMEKEIEYRHEPKKDDIPYRGHRYFPLIFEKNPSGIGLSEKQKKIEKILDIIGNVLKVFDHDEDEEVEMKKFERKIKKLNLDITPKFEKVKEIYDFIFENYKDRFKQKTSDKKLKDMIEEILSWIPKKYFDEDVTPDKLKFVQFQDDDNYYLNLAFDDMRIAFDRG